MTSPDPVPTRLLTVGELRKRLEALPDDAIVMLSCDDGHYSGPVEPETEIKTAALYGPCQYQTSPEDAYGRKVAVKSRTHPGGWFVIEDDHDRSVFADEPVLARRVAFVFSNGNNNA